MKQWLKIRDFPEYCGVSQRTARNWLKDGLKFSRIGGTILIKSDDLDTFIERHSVAEDEINGIVNSVISDLKNE